MFLKQRVIYKMFFKKYYFVLLSLIFMYCVANIHLKDSLFIPPFLYSSFPPFPPIYCPSQQYSVYPIIWAAGRGHADIVHLLLQNGAKVNCCDKVTWQNYPCFSLCYAC